MNRSTEPKDRADDTVLSLRTPPHADEAEQSVLGGLLLDNGSWVRLGALTEADFYRLENRRIFGAIGALVTTGKPADVITVFERLREQGCADDAGGLAYLNALAQSVPSAANVRSYASIVRERAILRQCLAITSEIATRVHARAPDGMVPANQAKDVVDFAVGAFGQLDRAGQRADPKPLAALLATALGRYEALAEGRTDASPLTIPTGIRPLDRMLNGGLRPGKLYGLAARPSVGKSAGGRYMGLHAAKHGHTTLLLSMEMQHDEVADCIVAQVAGIDSARVQTGEFSNEEGEWSRLADAVDEMRDWPFHVDEQGGLSLADIRAKARQIKGLKVLIVDYLQLSRSTLKGATTNDQIAEISKGLKALAMELKIAVIVLSQLNREVEKREDKEPQLSDLRDSGAIEQDLDAAIMLWTVSESNGGADRLVGWKVAKHRGGRKGRFGMRFDAARYRWTDTVESIDLAPRATKPARGGAL